MVNAPSKIKLQCVTTSVSIVQAFKYPLELFHDFNRDLIIAHTKTPVRLDPARQFAFGPSRFVPTTDPHVVRRLYDVGDVSLRVSLKTRAQISICKTLVIQLLNEGTTLSTKRLDSTNSITHLFFFGGKVKTVAAVFQPSQVGYRVSVDPP